MSSEIAISVRNLGKTYRMFGHPGDRIKQALTFGRVPFHREFTALKDVSFDIRKGETVGIIGRNGSGKSTLLQLLCGILKPSVGSVTVNGRVSALLELGAGFNPEFTGRENVYFQGALVGFTKREMDGRFDDIATFADIGEFIEQPVRMYSSGMFVRLAFAVAIHMDPEILVIDEALGVGDFAFQGKCFQRINAIREKGGSILLVTHAAEQVAHFCDRALLLDKGEVIACGDTSAVLARYVKNLAGGESEVVSVDACEMPGLEDGLKYHAAYNKNETRWGDRAAVITNFCLIQDGNKNPSAVVPGVSLELRFCVNFYRRAENPIYGISIKSTSGATVFTTNSRKLGSAYSVPSQNEGDSISVCFEILPFLEVGDYFVSVGVVSESASGVVPHDRRYDVVRFRVAMPRAPSGDIDMVPSFRILE